MFDVPRSVEFPVEYVNAVFEYEGKQVKIIRRCYDMRHYQVETTDGECTLLVDAHYVTQNVRPNIPFHRIFKVEVYEVEEKDGEEFFSVGLQYHQSGGMDGFRAIFVPVEHLKKLGIIKQARDYSKKVQRYLRSKEGLSYAKELLKEELDKKFGKVS